MKWFLEPRDDPGGKAYLKVFLISLAVFSASFGGCSTDFLQHKTPMPLTKWKLLKDIGAYYLFTRHPGIHWHDFRNKRSLKLVKSKSPPKPPQKK